MVTTKYINNVLARRGLALGWSNTVKADTIYYKDEWKNHERNWGGITIPVDPGHLPEKTNQRIQELGFIRERLGLGSMWILRK
jgi:hypothetical protein